MHRLLYLIASLFLCVLLFAAGCTQNSGTQSPLTPLPSPTHEISALSLLSSEVPAGFVLKDARTKQPGELKGLAADLGWEGGYVTHFTKLSDNPVNTSEISQSIARYPAKNITTIRSYAMMGDKVDKDYFYTELTSPALGDYSEAFLANARARMIIKPDESNPSTSLNLPP